jgi:mannose-1-phosphate guanylyltransferase
VDPPSGGQRRCQSKGWGRIVSAEQDGQDRRITPVILSGGAGTRLWPRSRTSKPKQMLPLTGSETMLQMTMRRVADAALFRAPMLVVSEQHAAIVDAQLSEAGLAADLLILEPSGRNTAPAIALAAMAANADDLLLVMPSDHRITDPDSFTAAVERASAIASEGWLVTFGIRPDRPETGYGYIKRGEALMTGVFRAEQFIEKPDAATAQAYIDQGDYEWNGGIFLFKAGAFLAALERHAPAIHAAVREAADGATRDQRRVRPDGKAFANAPAISIDHAVMELADRIAVVPVDMGWSDAGSWDAIYEIGEKDSEGNVLGSDVLALDSRNCLLQSSGPLLVTVGVEDLVVIATDDAILVLPRGQTQRVRAAVDALRERSDPTLN